MAIFTTILDADKHILSCDDEVLFTMNQVNKTIKKIIIEDKLLYRKYIHFKIIFDQILKSIRICSRLSIVNVCITNSYSLTIHDVKLLVPSATEIQKSSIGHTIYQISANKVLNSLSVIICALDDRFYYEKVHKKRFINCIEY